MEFDCGSDDFGTVHGEVMVAVDDSQFDPSGCSLGRRGEFPYVAERSGVIVGSMEEQRWDVGGEQVGAGA